MTYQNGKSFFKCKPSIEGNTVYFYFYTRKVQSESDERDFNGS